MRHQVYSNKYIYLVDVGVSSGVEGGTSVISAKVGAGVGGGGRVSVAAGNFVEVGGREGIFVEVGFS